MPGTPPDGFRPGFGELGLNTALGMRQVGRSEQPALMSGMLLEVLCQQRPIDRIQVPAVEVQRNNEF
jgi:hypothetical protein